MRSITTLLLFAGLMFCKSQAQSIQSVIPNTGKRNTSLIVTISGSNTHFTNSSSTVTFFWQGSPTAFVQASSTTALTDEILISAIEIKPNAPKGNYTLQVINSVDGLMTKTAAFSVIDNTSIEPPYGTKGSTLDVTITGSGTNFTQVSSTLVTFFYMGSPSIKIQVNSTAAIDDERLSANIHIDADAPNGPYDVFVYNVTDGMMEIINGFTTVMTSVNGPSVLNSEISLYPNPASGKMFIRTDLVTACNGSIILTDMLGRKSAEIVLTLHEGYNETELDISALNIGSGMFLATIQLGNETITKRFIVR